MRLDTQSADATSDRLEPAEALGRESASFGEAGDGLQLGPLYYAALWVNLTMLAALVILPRAPWPIAALELGAWMAALALLMLPARAWRPALHDMLIALQPRERLGMAVLVGCFFLMPGVTPHATIIPDGFLWAAPLLTLLAVGPRAARMLLGWTLLGAWFALYWAGGMGGVVLAALFGASWLLALGAAHFTFTGEPYGLTGWWPATRLVRSVAAAAIPAALAAGAMAWIWRLARPAPRSAASPERLAAEDLRRRMLQNMNTFDLLALAWRGLVPLVGVVIAFALLLYLRRRWIRRRAGMDLPEMLPGQTARLEYEALPPAAPAPRLAGRRGRIAGLWGRWAATLEMSGAAAPARAPGETAAAFGGRASGSPRAASMPPPLANASDANRAITELLERAHYGPAEPSPEDLARMRALVADEISRISLERQTPAQPLPDEL